MKGKVDLVTLVVAVPVIIVMILFGSVLVLLHSVEAEVDAQSQLQTEVFESQMAATHLITYNDTYENLQNYSAGGYSLDWIVDDINNVSETIEGDYEHRIDISEDERNLMLIETDRFQSGQYHQKIGVATPEKNSSITIEVETHR